MEKNDSPDQDQEELRRALIDSSLPLALTVDGPPVNLVGLAKSLVMIIDQLRRLGIDPTRITLVATPTPTGVALLCVTGVTELMHEAN